MFINVCQSPYRLHHFPPIFPWLLFFLNWLIANGITTKAKTAECSEDADCEKIWPNSNCDLRHRCKCAANELRRQSPIRGWVCLTLLDAVSSSIGPPATCPLPAGAGYATIERDKNGRPVFCRIQSTKTAEGANDGTNDQCGPGYECIGAAGQFSDQWDGVCCPMAKELVCRTLPAGNGLNGRLPRFWWNGTECLHFLWAPEETHKTRCANTFITKEHCLSFCGAITHQSASFFDYQNFLHNLASTGHHQMNNGKTGEFVGNKKIILGSPFYTLSRVLLNSLLDKTFKEELQVQKSGFNEKIMELQFDTQIVCRDREVRWILAMSRKFHLGLGTTGLAIAIVDRMLRMINVQGKYIHCLGVAALALAVKFHEEIDAHSEAFEASRESALMLAIPSPDPLNADDLAAKIRATSFFSKQELNRMERALLSKMDWDMLLPSFDRFLQAMLAVIGAPHLAASSILRRNFEVVISSGALVWRYGPPILALSLLSIMLELSTSISSSQWPRIIESLKTIFQIETKILEKCRYEMTELLGGDSNPWVNPPMEISLLGRNHQQQWKKPRKKLPSNQTMNGIGGKHYRKKTTMFKAFDLDQVEQN